MPHKVAAFYQFAALPDFRDLREPLRALCAGLKLKGSVLLAHEGINGTLAGGADAIDALVEELRDGALFGGRLDNLELKFSTAAAMPFRPAENPPEKGNRHARRRQADPTRQVGIYVDPADWNALIAAPDTLVIDTRNAFEVAMGTFDGAIDPGIASFGQFKDFAARHLDPAKHRKIAMFCTGGIRCEKASALSARARLCRGLSPQGRHPEISGRRAGSGEPLARRMLCVRRPRRARPWLAGAPNGDGDSDE